MKKNGTLIFVLIAIVLAVAAGIYFWVNRNKENGTKGGNNNTNSGNNTGNTGSGGGTVNPAIGKDAWASTDGVKVFNADLSVYKTAKSGEWVGKVYSEKYMHIPGAYNSSTNTYSYGSDGQVYVLGANDKYAKFVDKNQVDLN